MSRERLVTGAIHALMLLCATSAWGAQLEVVEDKVAASPKLFGLPDKLLPTGAPNGAFAGLAVAIGYDVALVGAPRGPLGAEGSVFVYRRQPNGVYAFSQRMISPDGTNAGNRFGESIALQGDRFVIGAPGQDGDGAAYVCRVIPTGIALVQELTATDGLPNDGFGTSVAIDGNTVVVGATLSNVGAVEPGAVYVFTHPGNFAYTQQAKLASNSGGAAFTPSNGDFFGAAVAIRGNALYVGAPFHNGDIGLVLKFLRAGTIWNYSGVNRDGGATAEKFGSAIAVSPNGSNVYIGAPQALNGGALPVGAVSVYDDSGGFLGFSDRLQDNAAIGSRFGGSLAADDANLVVGAPGFQGTFPEQGAFYQYVGDATAGLTQTRKVVATDAAADDKFGAGIAFFGGAVLAGATGDDDVQPDAGSAYAYDAVVQETALVDPAGGPDDVFGSAVAIAGNVKLIGTPHSGSSGSVEVYFRLVETWTQSNNDIRPSVSQSESAFGASVAMSDDTRVVVVGAPRYDETANDERGRAFVFERSGDTWVPAGELLAPDRANGDNFGASVSISPNGNTIVVGAPNRGAADDGKIYVFKRPAPGPLASAKGAGFAMTGSVGGGIGDKFGTSVAVADSGAIAVGAPTRDQPGRVDGGGVDVLRENGPGYAAEPLADPTGAAGDNFGTAVAMLGGELAIGIPNADRAGQPATDNAGAAMMFDTGSTSSTPRGRLMPADARIGDKFGTSVGISNGIAIVGAPLRDVPIAGGGTRPDAGSARLMLRSGATWSVDAEIIATDNDLGDNFGSAVAIRDLTLTAGAPLNDNEADNFDDQGASYVFRIGPRDPALFESSFE